MEVVVLLSAGRHPATGRPRRAALDAQALELALALPGARVAALHAGDPAEPCLRDYLGMGLAAIEALAVPPGCDPVPALAARLTALAPALVLAGATAEHGEQSGLVPYLIAEALGAALAPDIVALSRRADGPAEGGAELVQALPRGQRRALAALFPLVATVHAAAPPARPPAFAKARAGRIVTCAASVAAADEYLAAVAIRPWRAQAARAAAPRGKDAAARLRALTEARAGAGRLMVQPSPDEAARAIRDLLVERGLVAGPARQARRDAPDHRQ